MAHNDLPALIEPRNDDLIINNDQRDHLIAIIEDYKKEKSRYPDNIIFSFEMAQRYFETFVNGKANIVKYKGKYIAFTVNRRLMATQFIVQ